MHVLIEQISKDLEAVTRGISAEELAFVRQPGKWSAGEILEHLMLAYTATTLGMTRSLEQGVKDFPVPSGKQRFFRAILLSIGFFPPGRKAPESVVPTGKDPGYALEGARKSLPAMDLAITACEERFGANRPCVLHPRLGALSASEWRRFHHVHTRHHLKQITQIRLLAVQAAKQATRLA